MLKAKDMLSITNKSKKAYKYCEQVLNHAKSYAEGGDNRSLTYLHEDEFSNINKSTVEKMKDIFNDLGYQYYIELYDEPTEYLGEIKLFWEGADK